MKHSYFCESCEVLHTKSFFFDTCTIFVSLLRVDSCYRSSRYMLEVTRYSSRNYLFATSVRVDDVCIHYTTALSSYLACVERYHHFYELRFK